MIYALIVKDLHQKLILIFYKNIFKLEHYLTPINIIKKVKNLFKENYYE